MVLSLEKKIILKGYCFLKFRGDFFLVMIKGMIFIELLIFSYWLFFYLNIYFIKIDFFGIRVYIVLLFKVV